MAMETYLDLGDKTKAAEFALDLTKQLNSERPWNTQALAYALKVFGKFQTNQLAGGNWSFKYSEQNGNKKSINSKLASSLIQPGGSGKLPSTVTIENTSSNPIYAQSSVRYQPAVDLEGSVANHLKINVVYKDEDQNTQDATTLKKGDLIWVNVTVSNPGTKFKTYNNLALTQLFPAGWEIINQRMSEVQGPAQLFDYQDIRDDRVMTFFKLDQGKSKTFTIQVRATYEGQFHLPAALCEEMYDASVNAKTEAGVVMVER
jgi:uncharacterized protein YfaS (alpha-2-macroglobulin family)